MNELNKMMWAGALVVEQQILDLDRLDVGRLPVVSGPG